MTCPVRERNWFEGEAGLMGEDGHGGMEGTGQWEAGWWRGRACESSALARSALQRVPGSKELTLQPLVPTPPPAPFSFEAGGKGGWWQEGEWRLLSRPQNVLFSWGGCQLWPGLQAPTRHFLCP